LDITPNVPLFDTYPMSRCAWLDGRVDGSDIADARFERPDL
jgi:hypothetical protein